MSIRVISPNLPNGSPDNHVRLKLDVTQRGQTVFAIGRPIRSDYNYFLFLNGVQQTQGVDYTVSDVALTWSGRKLWLTDILEFYFYVEDSVETTLPTNDYTPPPDQEEDTPSTPSDPLPDVEPPPVTPPTSSKSIIGINLCDVADYSPALPFVNLMKFAREWTPCTATKWNTGDTLELDNNGYVKRIPTGAAYTLVSTVVCTSQNEYLAGKYHVLYDGDGKLEYKRDAVKNTSLSVPGHDVINVNPARGIQLNITYINPNNYIRNIRIVHENYLNNYQTQIFNPTYLERLAPFGTIRFMNWMSTNGSMQTGWDTRKTPDHATWAGYTPVEIMVEFCNRLNVDPWFNMPHMCLDDYVYSFASYVKDHLNPDLHVYVEYTNEAWNFSPAFWQSRWIVSRSAEDFPDFAGGNNLRAINWFSRRTTQICQIWDEVYGDDKAKVIGVMGAWAANYDRADKLLRYGWTNNPLTHQEYGIDAIAIAPYFGGHLERLYSDVIQSVDNLKHLQDQLYLKCIANQIS